ncbi:hypothetical protein J6590_087925 [Homalodisca vitripennis]|nr:hypothetical protein J6590_087925 [Homalodisca vitripennis]
MKDGMNNSKQKKRNDSSLESIVARSFFYGLFYSGRDRCNYTRCGFPRGDFRPQRSVELQSSKRLPSPLCPLPSHSHAPTPRAQFRMMSVMPVR